MRRLGSTLFGAASNLLAQGVPFLLLLFVTPILLHALGREVYGALILFNLIPQIAGQLDLGMVTAGTRAYAQFAARGQMQDARRIIHETMTILGLWGALMAACYLYWRHGIADVLQLGPAIGNDTMVFAVSAIGIPLALINGVALIPLRAVEQYGRAARIQIVAGLVYWTVCASAASHGATLIQLVALGTASVACTTLALFMTVARARRAGLASGAISAEQQVATGAVDALALDDLTPSASKSAFRMRPFLPLGAGAFVAQASSLATYHTDKLLVSAMISPAAAGAYAVCANIANKILLVVAAGATYTFPRAAKLHAQGDLEAVVRTFVLTTRFVLMISTALAVPLIALAGPFLRVWIGADFADQYTPIMQLLVIGYAINASSVVASNIAIGVGESRLPAVFSVLGGVTTIVAVLVLAPRLGAPGAALAGTIGMSQAMVFNSMVARRLGPGARQASWPLVIRLVLVALPVALLTAWAGSLVVGWLSLVALGGLASAAFVAVWLLTFGRDSDRIVIEALLARIMHRPMRTE